MKRSRFEHSKELHLDLRVELSNLIEEDRLARRSTFEVPHALGNRPRERTLFMAEKLGLDELLRHRGEVQRVERSAKAPGEAAARRIEPNEGREGDGAGDELLARTGRSEDQRTRLVHPAA